MKRYPLMCALAGVFAMTASAQAATVLTGPVSNPANGHLYYLLTPDSFQNSEALAVTLGGHLATVNDLAENTFLVTNFSNFGNINRPLGIGFNDIASEGNFTWISGESNAFTNWAIGEPNNGLGGPVEHWAYIVEPGNQNLPPTQWNDGPVNGIGIHGVVEVNAIPEPSTLSLLGGVAVGLLARRSRR